MEDSPTKTAHCAPETDEEALVRCQAALEQKYKGDYERAQEVMRRLWRGVGERPETQGLHASVSAEGLLCVGILTGWIGSKIQIKDAQEDAKNLQDRLLKYEKTLIKQALAQANGRVTHAASLLSIVVKR